MAEVVTVRDLRNHGGEVLRRVERGERIVVTRDGAAVAELNPLPRRSAGPAELIRRRRNLPHVDVDVLRSDVDSVMDSSL
ncbi:type II toxin-antitoxin system Phd/YefM family antitoxin [Mycolicibacter icosiumassiliensis]|uniref:type II toxin-antitoxin system Phd/YefM family antitoxin n=1 Tax=Mycolicibacter icosiumassiliensis TaxID=1792835 RepID=UPI0008301B62|nr:type II toxin-antitoxin system prevent-host-death family antitoxin [Mycolicibacter icosiumassiliensis]